MQWDDIPPVLNYLRVRAPGHPLANTQGVLMLHRWVAYRRLGPGPHPCHWCGVLVNWTPAGEDERILVVDHVDGNRGNNEDDNLVPACQPCNIWRARGGPLAAHERTVRMAAGPTRAGEVVCEECGRAYLTRLQRVGVQQFCSRSCQWTAGGRARRVPADEPHVVTASGGRLRAVERVCETCGLTFLVERGRLKKGTTRFCSESCRSKTTSRGPRPGHAGERNHHAALTEDAVREMRRQWAAGGITLAELGARFGVTKSGANMVVYRRSWKHVL